MIAIALGMISAVVMISTGVVVSSSDADRLTFLGVAVETTTAQVFLTGAILAWVFVVALWLLRIGMQRSGARCAELAGRWAGFGTRVRSGLVADGVPDGVLSGGDDAGGDVAIGIGGTGPGGDGGGPPRRVHSGPDLADGVGALAGEQPGVLMPRDVFGPGAGSAGVVGIGVDCGGQRGEVGGGTRFVASEYRRPDREPGHGAGGQ